MELREPVKRAGNQKTLNFGSPVIVDQRVPILVKAFARILMFVKRSAVEIYQSMRIAREMTRHPIENDAKISAVALIDKMGEFLRLPVSRGRGKLRQRLIAP